MVIATATTTTTTTTVMNKAASVHEGIKYPYKQLRYGSMVGLKKGGLYIHHGKIWHGSNSNSSKR